MHRYGQTQFACVPSEYDKLSTRPCADRQQQLYPRDLLTYTGSGLHLPHLLYVTNTHTQSVIVR